MGGVGGLRPGPSPSILDSTNVLLIMRIVLTSTNVLPVEKPVENFIAIATHSQ